MTLVTFFFVSYFIETRSPLFFFPLHHEVTEECITIIILLPLDSYHMEHGMSIFFLIIVVIFS
jgi:hypothetical protein